MKNLKSILFLAIIGLILTSCAQVVFEQPLPKKGKTRKKIPESIQGTYSFVIMAKQATVTVGENFVKGDDGMSYLSDSLILKEVDGKFIFNKRISGSDPEVNGKWDTYIITQGGCGFLRATIFAVSDQKQQENFENAYSPTKVGDDKESFYVVNADDDLFWKLANDSSATLRIVLDKIHN